MLACREWSIEKALNKMEVDWEGMAFELAPWKETGVQLAECKEALLPNACSWLQKLPSLVFTKSFH